MSKVGIDYVFIGLGGLILMVSGACSTPVSRAGIGYAESSRDLPGVTNLSRDGMIYFAGQPSRQTLEAASQRGVKTIVNLRTADEMRSGVDFDEGETVQQLGMKYVNIPVTPESFAPADADRLHEVLGHTTDPVLIHCGSSNRVGALWAMYLHRRRGLTVDEAIERGRRAGLKSDQLTESIRKASQP